MHEICGLFFLAAVFIHNFFNRNFYKNFSKRGTLDKFCIVFFAAALIILTVSGIILCQAADNFNWRSVHLTAAICSVVLLFVHLLTHARKYIHGKIFYAASILAFIFAVAGILGLHISTTFDSMLQREEIVLTGKFATKKNSSSIAGDNINRIIEMAKGWTKAAEIKQIEIDGLNDKIQAGISELAQPFPQQEKYEKLSLAELTTLLNQDAEIIKNNEDIHSESMLRINSILNLPPDSLSKCETEFFDFAKKNLSAVDNNWSPSFDEKAVLFLLDEGFSKESISDTLLKFSPSVPGKENVHQIIEDCTSRAASCR